MKHSKTLLLAAAAAGAARASCWCWIVRSRPAEALRGEVPPIEVLAFTRVDPGAERDPSVECSTTGPIRLTIAQVVRWTTPTGPSPRARRASSDAWGARELRIPYPWVTGETHFIKLITRNGLTFEHEIAVALPTPQPTLRAVLALRTDRVSTSV